MKKNVIKLLFAVLFFGAGLTAQAQIYVKIRPPVPVVVVTERPSPRHVWIGEEWDENNGGYIYSGSRWDTPRRDGDDWHQGHWNHHKEHGDHWEHGGWKGRK